jgi:hypothetical protein
MAVRFTRNPKFTPATLTAAELTRCERIAKGYFHKHQTMRMAFDKGDGETTLVWIINEWKHGKTNVSRWLDNDARYAYTKSCLNYLIACGLNSGELESSGRSSSRKWAYASGYYQ